MRWVWLNVRNCIILVPKNETQENYGGNEEQEQNEEDGGTTHYIQSTKSTQPNKIQFQEQDQNRPAEVPNEEEKQEKHDNLALAAVDDLIDDNDVEEKIQEEPP